MGTGSVDNLFDGRFLVYTYEGKIELNHYNCDTSITKFGIDASLDDLVQTAQEHLKECDK